MGKIDGYINLLFEIFGLTSWDKFGKEKAIKLRYGIKRKHWWQGLINKPNYYKDWSKENSKSKNK